MQQKKLEKAILAPFPAQCTSSHITSLFGEAVYERDTRALAQTINVPVRDFLLRGGKRVRPNLFLALLSCFGADPGRFLYIASAIEIAHNATLIIDDIEDDSELRRGAPACHKQFGIDVAVNNGVLLHILPLGELIKHMRQQKIDMKTQLRLIQIYTEELSNVYAGQSIDIYWHRGGAVRIHERLYLEMCRLKTGALMRMAARMAMVVAGKSSAIEAKFARFAELMGIAYQIQDDVLDLSSETKKFGKSFGNDVTEGKYSLPVIFACTMLRKTDAERLRHILGLHTRDEALLSEAVTLITSTGALDKAAKYAKALLEESWQVITDEVPNTVRSEDFKKLVGFAVDRAY